MNSKIDTLIFDLDGTLFDSHPVLLKALKTTYEFYHNQPFEYFPELHSLLNLERKVLLQAIFKNSFTTEHEDFLIETHKALHAEIKPYPDVQNVIETLDQNSIPWGIATNKPKHSLLFLAEQYSFLTSAKCLISAEDVKARKPDPVMLLQAMDIMGSSPDRTAYVGDSLTDYQVANNCGMPFIFAAYGYESDKKHDQPWLSINCIREVLDCLNIKDYA